MTRWSFDDSWTPSQEIEEIVAYIDRSLSRSRSLPFCAVFYIECCTNGQGMRVGNT